MYYSSRVYENTLIIFLKQKVMRVYTFKSGNF